jgi:hypothetical protein
MELQLTARRINFLAFSCTVSCITVVERNVRETHRQTWTKLLLNDPTVGR